MWDEDGFTRKSTRMAAIEAAKRIKKNAEDTAHNYPLCRPEIVTQSDVETQRQRGHKQKTEDQVFDSAEMMRDLAKNISECSNPPKSDSMPKKQRRPTTSKSEKCPSRRRKNAKYKDATSKEDDYDVNLRRESYNRFLLNNEPILPMPFSGSKRLVNGDGGISYKDSLLNFTKGLGPTAKKVAHQMLQRQGPTHQAQHQLEPLFQSTDGLKHPHLFDLNSINNDSVKNSISNQVNQPLISFGDSNANAIANYKGKRIMVDDGKSDRGKWSVADNMEFFFGKQKGGVKIGCGSLDNKDFGKSDRDKWSVADNMEFFFGKQKGGVKIGSGSIDNKDFGNRKLDYGQVGSNQRTINQIGSFWSNCSGILNQNTNKNSGVEEIFGQKEVSWNASHGIPNASVYPVTNVSRTPNISSSSWGFNGDVSKFSWVPQPSMHSPTPVQPPKNWCLPQNATTTNSAVNDNFWKDQEFQLALALNKHMKDKESNVWSHNLWAPSQTNQFLQAHSHKPVPQQPQERLVLNPTPPNFWSQIAMSAAKPELHPLPFGTQQYSGFPKGNHPQHPPPGF